MEALIEIVGAIIDFFAGLIGFSKSSEMKWIKNKNKKKNKE